MATPTNSGVSSDLRVRVDQAQCTGDGLCVTRAPTVFEHDIDGLAYVKTTGGELLTAPGAQVIIPLTLLSAVIDAADECPGDCIYVQREDGTMEAGPGS